MPRWVRPARWAAFARRRSTTRKRKRRTAARRDASAWRFPEEKWWIGCDVHFGRGSIPAAGAKQHARSEIPADRDAEQAWRDDRDVVFQFPRHWIERSGD